MAWDAGYGLDDKLLRPATDPNSAADTFRDPSLFVPRDQDPGSGNPDPGDEIKSRIIFLFRELSINFWVNNT